MGKNEEMAGFLRGKGEALVSYMLYLEIPIRQKGS